MEACCISFLVQSVCTLFYEAIASLYADMHQAA